MSSSRSSPLVSGDTTYQVQLGQVSPSGVYEATIPAEKDKPALFLESNCPLSVFTNNNGHDNFRLSRSGSMYKRSTSLKKMKNNFPEMNNACGCSTGPQGGYCSPPRVENNCCSVSNGNYGGGGCCSGGCGSCAGCSNPAGAGAYGANQHNPQPMSIPQGQQQMFQGGYNMGGVAQTNQHCCHGHCCPPPQAQSAAPCHGMHYYHQNAPTVGPLGHTNILPKTIFDCVECGRTVPASFGTHCHMTVCRSRSGCDMILHSETDWLMHMAASHKEEFARFIWCAICQRPYPPEHFQVRSRACADCRGPVY